MGVHVQSMMSAVHRLTVNKTYAHKGIYQVVTAKMILNVWLVMVATMEIAHFCGL